MALAALECPSGSYCPSPAEIHDCTPGHFCSHGTVQPLTCNISTLVSAYPSLDMPSLPTTMYQSVYLRGTQLAGNLCPTNSSTPTAPCAGGYYCPNSGESIVCPAGYYCKEGSQEPSKCPALTSCPEGSDKARLSWVGFILLAGVLIVLWVSYLLATTALRINQRRLARTQSAKERLWKLLNPLFASQQHSKSQAFRAFKVIRPKINVQFENLGLTLHDGTPILSDVSGRFNHSRVAAIMGPSGAGKSTFLNVIMGKSRALGRVTGRVRANGRDMKPEALRDIVGFVPQEDIVHEDLTVRENLVYSARLRLSAAKPLKEQMALVDDVVNVLQLRHVQHNVIGTAERRGISGGQRKRVNIGTELVAKPSIMYMDEPTSGLDATAAADILGALKRMAGLGMNIITVIHQPRFSIFSLFDDVMLLCKGGRLAYLGPSNLAIPYLESLGFALPPNENPADFAMDVLSGCVPRNDHPEFQPEDLVPMWIDQGNRWVQEQRTWFPSTLSRLNAPNKTANIVQEAVDPEQLRLLESEFDEADTDGDGSIDAAGLRSLLQGLGLEPTSADVNIIVSELALPGTGLISKESFLQYVRFGGRPPTIDAPKPPNGGSKRRVDSLYRVYSIEQYSLGNALAEMAAAHLPAALKADPPPTLKEMAAAVVQQESEAMDARGAMDTRSMAQIVRRNTTLTKVSAAIPIPEGEEDAPTEGDIDGDIDLDGEAEPEVETDADGEAQTTLRTLSSLGSVTSLHLPGGGDAGSLASAPSLTRPCVDLSSFTTTRTGGQHKNGRESYSSRDSRDLQVNHGFWSRALCCLGLDGYSGRLRITPGVFGQLYVLISRAGIKWARNWAVKFTDLLLFIVAAAACGAIHGTGWGISDIQGHEALVMLTLGVLSAATSLSVFGKDRLVFSRERSSGIGVLPYFLANTALNLIDIAIYPLVFLSIYQSMTVPVVPFYLHYLIGFLVVWWTSSAGCLVSVLVGQPANALVAAVAVVMITGGFINGVSPSYRDMGTTTKDLSVLSYNRWAVEAVVIASFKQYPSYIWPLSKALINTMGYCGLDNSQVPPLSSSSLKGNYVIASNAPAWNDPWQQQGELLLSLRIFFCLYIYGPRPSLVAFALHNQSIESVHLHMCNHLLFANDIHVFSPQSLHQT